MKNKRNIITIAICTSVAILANAQSELIPSEFRGVWSSNKNECQEILKSGGMPGSAALTIAQKEIDFGGMSNCSVSKKSKMTKNQLSGEYKCASEGEENVTKLSLTLTTSDQISDKSNDGKITVYYRCLK